MTLEAETEDLWLRKIGERLGKMPNTTIMNLRCDALRAPRHWLQNSLLNELGNVDDIAQAFLMKDISNDASLNADSPSSAENETSDSDVAGVSSYILNLFDIP